MANQRGETTSIGHFYNRCIDAVNNLFDTMSFWTHSKDVEFVDGKTAETKVGAINGITSDMSGEADDIAASIKCVNQLNNSLGGLKFGTDGEGNYGYFGDDDVLVPFKSGLQGNVVFSQTTKVKTVTINNLTKGNKYLLEVTVDSSNGSAQALKDVVITSASGCTFTLVNTHSANYYSASKMYLIKTTDTTITLNSSGYAMWYLFE